MGDVLEDIFALDIALAEVAHDAAKDIWDDVALPILGEVFSWLGIEDQTIVTVQRLSSKFTEEDNIDPYDVAIQKAVIAKMRTGDSFYTSYTKYVSASRSQLKAYYSYAKNSSYVHGLPEVSVQGTTIDTVAVKVALDLEFSIDSVVLSAIGKLPNVTEYYRNDLQAAPTNYNAYTDELTYNALQYRYFYTEVRPTDYLLHLLPIAAGPLEFISKPFFTDNQTLIVHYHVDGDPTTEAIWHYDISSEVYPDIAPVQDGLANLDMLPAALLRKDKVSIVTTDLFESGVDYNNPGPSNSLTLSIAPTKPEFLRVRFDGKLQDKNSYSFAALVVTFDENIDAGVLEIEVDILGVDYFTTRQLMQYLYLDLDDVINSVEENPDIDLIDDCYINFSVCPNDTHAVVSKILFLSFYELHVVHSLTSDTNQFSAAFIEGDIQNALVWSGFGWNTSVVGSVTDVGEYVHHTDTRTVTATDAEGNESSTVVTDIYLRHQVTETEYDELIIRGLNGLSTVEYDGYHNIAFNTLGDSDLTVPVSYFVFDKLTPRETLEAYPFMLRLDLTAIQVTELAWYETNAFLMLFEGVLMFINLIFLGTTSGLTEAARQLLVQYFVSELVAVIAEETGNEAFAAIVGTIATIALSKGGTEAFSSMRTADQILDVTTNFADNYTQAFGVTDVQFQAELETIAQATEDLDEMAEELSPAKGAVGIDFMLSLESPDVQIYKARENQYNFDQHFDYDRIIADFYENTFRIGVV